MTTNIHQCAACCRKMVVAKPGDVCTICDGHYRTLASRDRKIAELESQLAARTNERDQQATRIAAMNTKFEACARGAVRLCNATVGLARRMEINELIGKTDSLGRDDQAAYDEAKAAHAHLTGLYQEFFTK